MDRKTTYVLNSVVRELFEDGASLDASGGILSGRLPDGTEVHTNIGPAAKSVIDNVSAYREAQSPSWWQNLAGWFGDKTGSEYFRNVRDDAMGPMRRNIQKGVESVQDNVNAFKSAQIQKAALAQAQRDQAEAMANSGDEPGLWSAITNSRPARALGRGLGDLSKSRDAYYWGTANLPPVERAGKNAGFEAKWIGSTGDGKPVDASTRTSIAHALEDVAGQNDPWYTKGMREMRQGAENIGASMADHPWLWGGGLGAAALAAGAGAMYLRKKKKEANQA